MIYELNRFLPNVLLLPVMIIRQVWFRSYNLQHAQGVSITQHYSVFSRGHCRPHTWWHYPLVTLLPAMNIVTSQASRLNSYSMFFSCGSMWSDPERTLNILVKKNIFQHFTLQHFSVLALVIRGRWLSEHWVSDCGW